MIQAVEYLCFYLGVVLFALGLISLIIKRQWRLGIIVILIADVPLATAIAFPKILAMWCDEHNIHFNYHTGMVVGIVSAIVIYALFSLIFNKYLVPFFYKTSTFDKEQDASDKRDDENIKKSENDSLKIFTSLFKKERQEPKRSTTLNQGYANPSLFANVKRKD